jgi:hypothetical protein
MPSIDHIAETDAHPINGVTGLFHGFAVPVSESVAELIFQYVVDSPFDGNIWRAKSLYFSQPNMLNGIFSSTSFYG